MVESIEHLIKVTNDSMKSVSENIQEYITEISLINNTENYNIQKLEDLNDDLNQLLERKRRLKLLKNKLIKMKSEKDSLTMLAYKPERITSDHRKKWIRE